MNAPTDTRRFTAASDAIEATEAPAHAAVAQPVEHRSEDPGVGGSNPPRGAMTKIEDDEGNVVGEIRPAITVSTADGRFSGTVASVRPSRPVGHTKIAAVLDERASFGLSLPRPLQLREPIPGLCSR